jgi:hypothetical protein
MEGQPWRENQRLRGAVRAWLPATAVAAVLVVGLGGAAYFTLGRGLVGASPSPTPSPDIRSKEAVIAAVKNYYDIEAEARKTGNADLIDPITLGHASIASQNFHVFIAQQEAKNRRAVIDRDYFSGWSVTLNNANATAGYVWWVHGHDTEASTGSAVEADGFSTKGQYSARLALLNGRWLVAEVQLLQDNVP